MNNFEAQLAHMLRERSTDVDGNVAPARQIVRRARRRRTATLSVAVVALLGVVFTGVSLSTFNENDQGPAVPGEASPYPGSPEPFETGDDPATRRIEVATGERAGLQWKLGLYRNMDNRAQHPPRKDWCTFLDLDGEGAACPTGLRKNEHLSHGRDGGGDVEDALTGEVSKRVARIEIRLDGYGPFDVPVIPGPELDRREDPRVDFYLAFIPVESTGEIVVFDAAGNVLETAPIIVFPTPGPNVETPIRT